MSNLKRSILRGWLMISVLALVVFGAACGGAAEEQTSQPAASESMAAEESAKPEPTAVAVATAEPAESTEAMAPAGVNPGKLTLLTGSFGNERFERAIGSGGNTHIGRIIHGFLSGTNKNNEMLPGIASSWEYSPDGRTLTYTIREGVKFHDGSDLTAEDVEWTLRHSMSPEAIEAGVPLRGTGRRISAAMEKVEISGPNQVSMTGIEPLPQLTELLSEAGTSWFGMIPKRDEIWNEEVAAEYDRNPIAAGPMRLLKHTPAFSMEFERFGDYYYQPDNGLPEDHRVNFENLDLFLVPEEATRVAALEGGDADIIPVSLSSRNRVEAGGGRLIFARSGVSIVGWFFGCDRPGSDFPCRDKRVRQALDYALPKELLRDTLWGPDVFEIEGWYVIQPGTLAYFPEVKPRGFDPDKARALLAEAGYADGEGFQQIIINTRPAPVAPLLIESAQLVADTWRRELGISVEVRSGEHAAIAQKRVNLELDGQIWWRESSIPLDPTDTFQARWGDPESSWRATDDPDLISRVQELISIVDTEERIAAYKPLIEELTGDAYYLSPGYINVPFGVGPRVATWDPYPLKHFFSALHTVTLK